VKSILKYTMTGKETTFSMPKGAKVISAHNQRDEIVLWAVVDTSDAEPKETKDRTFAFVGTGKRITFDFMRFISTVLVYGGMEAYHVFELKPIQKD